MDDPRGPDSSTNAAGDALDRDPDGVWNRVRDAAKGREPGPDTMDAGSDQPGVSRGMPEIAGYDFVRELHRGGQGVVYQAIEKATKRKVAIKVLLEGPYASDHARRRFEREIELAASLKHPNIVAVFHSGLTPDGRQFCVMDYIRGVPLHQHVRDQKLALDDALKLFARVCDAVNYANQKGVIHRDLKPSNILVDTEGSPKVLDFGLAKQVGGPEQVVVSVTGQVVGTLQYMSPEQTRGNPDEIDIRTDVYSLGVVLYEMLTGHFPYPVIGPIVDVIKHIAGTEPAPPSRTWKAESGVTQRSGARASKRAVCPIDADLQTIVLRTLAKDRKRRYQSAADLGADIEHYLNDEPIEARRDSALYVLRKRLRRYRIAVALVALAAGLATAVVWGVKRERQHRLERSNDLADGARLNITSGDYQKAETDLRMALELNPSNFTALSNLATVKRFQYEKNRDETTINEALAILDNAARISTERAEPWNLKGIFLRNVGRLGDSLAALDQGLKIDRDYYPLYATRANTLALMNDWNGAERSLLDADRFEIPASDPAPWLTWRNLAVVQLVLGKPAAIEALRKAEDHDGKASPHVCIVEARLKLWLVSALDPSAALRALDAAERFSDKAPVPLWRLKRLRALAELRSKNWAAASAAAKEALSAQPSDPRPAQVQLIAAIADAHHGTRPEASKHMQSAIRQWPDDLAAAPNGVIGAVEPGGLLWFESIAEFETLRNEAEALLGPTATPATQPVNSDKNPQS